MLNEGFKRPVRTVVGGGEQQGFFAVEAAHVGIEAVKYCFELRGHAIIIKRRDEYDDVCLEQLWHELLLNSIV